MMRASQVASYLCTALIAGCLSVVPSVPSRGGAEWQRLEGPHFIVITNQDDDDALATLSELERFLQIFANFGWSLSSAQPHKVTAVVFENDVEMHAFVPHRWGGVFVSAAPYAPLIVGYNGADGFRSSVIRHELVHYLASLSTPRQPSWFAEGIACYYETASTTLGSDEVSLGRPHEGLASMIGQDGLLRAETLLDPLHDRHGRTFYPTAWLLVHYLMTTHQDALVAYHQRLIDGEDPTEAWAREFPSLTPSQLDVALEQYARRGRYQYSVRDVPQQRDLRFTRTPLVDADVLALRAYLFALNFSGRRSQTDANELALRDLDDATKLDPFHPLAALVRLHVVEHTPVEAVQLTADVTRAHPEDRDAWMLRVEALRDFGAEPSEIDAALGAALRHHPHDLTLLLAAFDAAQDVGDHARALDLVRTAKRLYGDDARVLINYATALFAFGACDTAHVSAERAIRRLPLDETQERIAMDNLTSAETACRERTPQSE